MKNDVDLPLEDLKRLPGLYRRWELADALEPHKKYQIEDAGHHADGSPLFAVYVCDFNENLEPVAQSVIGLSNDKSGHSAWEIGQ